MKIVLDQLTSPLIVAKTTTFPTSTVIFWNDIFKAARYVQTKISLNFVSKTM